MQLSRASVVNAARLECRKHVATPRSPRLDCSAGKSSRSLSVQVKLPKSQQLRIYLRRMLSWHKILSLCHTNKQDPVQVHQVSVQKQQRKSRAEQPTRRTRRSHKKPFPTNLPTTVATRAHHRRRASSTKTRTRVPCHLSHQKTTTRGNKIKVA